LSKKGRSETKDREFSKIQKLSHENKLLQREIAKLRRQLEKNNHMILRGPREPKEVNEELVEMTKKIKKRPCHKCGIGFLYIIKYDRAGEPYYYRQCNECDHRTRGQKHTESVED
jgi:hypothetical protein